MNKKTARIRRATKARVHMRRLGVPRLTVHRSGRHIYAQVIDGDAGNVLAAASTLQKGVREGLDSTSNKAAAVAVGKAVAEKAVAAGVTSVAFDRSGFKYHGRIKELADAAREAGLQF
ncbi:MAG: 50S ribosomal protein L18 [Xanthomonadales bacterium]|nr:50S ribosomal protein L18 [Gammaproteobacteria bacterium]NNE05901.1 50S ribosomal protein L18 [Xanthomonadales bacterium]NNL95037.1 50S ribosomal protein L18 [Xanthomonadales bacterium]